MLQMDFVQRRFIKMMYVIVQFHVEFVIKVVEFIYKRNK